MQFSPDRREPKRKLNILVVEDDQDCSELFRVSLEIAGHDVHAFSNAEGVWMFPNLEAVDVFLVDLTLPGIDGSTLIKSLRERIGRTPIGVISGHPPGSAQHRMAINAGTDFYLNKPVNLRDLVSTVCRYE
jgi:two-component system response regulator FlrC